MRYEKAADKKHYTFLVKSGDVNKNGYKAVIHCTPHYHKAREFVFITQGPQNAPLNGKNFHLETGDIFFTDSCQLHSYSKDSSEGYVLLIGQEYFSCFEDLYPGYSLKPMMTNKEKNQEMFDIILKWYEKGIDNPLYNYSATYNLINAIVAEYGIHEKEKNKLDTVVLKMISFMDKNITANFMLSDIAKHVGYSEVYCSKIFHKYLGENFSDYINRARVQLVQNKLASDNAGKLLNTVLECGFNSLSTFYRAYKKIYGKSPRNKK